MHIVRDFSPCQELELEMNTVHHFCLLAMCVHAFLMTYNERFEVKKGKGDDFQTGRKILHNWKPPKKEVNISLIYVQNQACGGWKDGNNPCLGHWINLKRIFVFLELIEKTISFYFIFYKAVFEKTDFEKMQVLLREWNDIPAVFPLMHSLNFSLSVYSSSFINPTDHLVIYAFASLSHGINENNFFLMQPTWPLDFNLNLQWNQNQSAITLLEPSPCNRKIVPVCYTL